MRKRHCMQLKNQTNCLITTTVTTAQLLQPYNCKQQQQHIKDTRQPKVLYHIYSQGISAVKMKQERSTVKRIRLYDKCCFIKQVNSYYES